MANDNIQEELRFRLRSVQRSASDTHTAPFLLGNVMGNILRWSVVRGALLQRWPTWINYWVVRLVVPFCMHRGPCVPCGSLELLGRFGTPYHSSPATAVC